ncbi:MAG: radical SAM protein [Lachnospiraceae bacterium]|nr:radical SAM protein [Lachnospiraceae bacterium]
MDFLKNEEGKIKMLFNDYVIKFDVCNFRCDYCLNLLEPKNTELWMDTKQKMIEEHDHYKRDILADELRNENVYECQNELGKRINRMLDSFEEIIDTPILRLSGGELFAIRNIEEFIVERGEKYAVVQIVTNGYYLDEKLIARLKNCGNVHIHFSLDGHTLEMNQKRVKNWQVQERLLGNLDMLIQNDIPVEINSVMSNANTKDYPEFLDYLLRYEDKLVAFPSPIRGVALEEHQPDFVSTRVFEKVADDYTKYSRILPPKQYFERLAAFYRDGIRKDQCVLPEFCIQSLDDGMITPCALGWTRQLGNLFAEDLKTVQDRIGHDKLYKLLCGEKIRMDYCKKCYSTYEVCNLFFNDILSIEEMRGMPLYSDRRVCKRLMELKEHREKNKPRF